MGASLLKKSINFYNLTNIITYIKILLNIHLFRIPEGWYKGTSWMTGTTGKFPISHTEIAVDTDTWTLHKLLFVVLI